MEKIIINKMETTILYKGKNNTTTFLQLKDLSLPEEDDKHLYIVDKITQKILSHRDDLITPSGKISKRMDGCLICSEFEI